MKKYWLLTIRDEFSAAHALRHYEGKCENPHGHNFTVEVVVKGDKLDDRTEMLLDFKILKEYLKSILGGLDHRMLNDTPPFDELNPSSENMAREIWQKMSEFLESCLPAIKGNVCLRSVSVSEKNTQSATYIEE